MPTLTFTSGNDTHVVNAAGTFTLDFLAGIDTLTVQHASATVDAVMGLGNDVVSLKAGSSTVHGNGGEDRFELYVAGTVYGDADADLFNIRGGTGLVADGGSEDDRFNFIAGAANVLLHGGSGNDDFFGYNKVITGAIHGDSGNDYFVQFRGAVTLYGGIGNDIYRADASNPATFVELAGAGIDSVQVARGVISYTLGANLENVSVQGFSGSSPGPAAIVGNALNNTINAHNNVETIAGMGGNDRLFGKGDDDTVYGGVGNDYLDGGPGDDALQGDSGNDTLQGRIGDDTMAGGAGDDVYYVDSDGDVVTEALGEGIDLVRVVEPGDLMSSNYVVPPNVEDVILGGTTYGLVNANGLDNDITGNGAANDLWGYVGNDTLRGGGGDDGLFGGIGNDVLSGGAGADDIEGHDGNDTLRGDSGDDILAGGLGSDTFSGGLGADEIYSSAGAGETPDTFAYDGLTDSPLGARDTIYHFASGDTLDLSAIDADTTAAGNQAFTFRGDGGSTGAAGDLWLTNPSTLVYALHGDVDGDGVADFSIGMLGGVASQSDIIL